MRIRRKVFVLGLDGATLDLIQPWIEAGDLPNFARLVEEGCVGELETVVPPVTAPAWSSFMTGKNPGKHGLFDFMRRQENSYRLSPVSADDQQERAIWEVIGESGKKVIVMNVPVTYPPRPVNGLMITGMLTPRSAPKYTYPEELARELEEHIGEYIIFPREVYNKGKVDQFIKELHYAVEKKFQAVSYLMKNHAWDFFMIVFPETDIIQHGLWSCMDATHPMCNLQEHEQYRTAILKLYQQIDDILGKIRKELGEETAFMIMSDHGAGPLHHFLHVSNFLFREGFLKFKKHPLTAFKYLMFQMGITPTTAYKILLSLNLGRLRRTMDKRRSGYSLMRKYFLSLSDVDWLRTKAYAVGGQIFINLKGREPEGIVEPGVEYEGVRDEIIEKLKKLEDPLVNGKVVGKVFKKEEIYSGRYLDRAADIIFLPRRPEMLAFADFEFSSNRLLEQPYAISGTHRMNGILFVAGKNIRKRVRIQGAAITDIAPTILCSLGLPIPDDMDGRVLTEIFNEDFLATSPIQYSSVSRTERRGRSEYSRDEEKEIVERLKSLGYLK